MSARTAREQWIADVVADHHLGSPAVRVAVGLSLRLDGRPYPGTVSIAEVVRLTGMSDSAVRRSVRALRKAGIVRIDALGGLGIDT